MEECAYLQEQTKLAVELLCNPDKKHKVQFFGKKYILVTEVSYFYDNDEQQAYPIIKASYKTNAEILLKYLLKQLFKAKESKTNSVWNGGKWYKLSDTDCLLKTNKEI